MENILPYSREYFRKFLKEHKLDFFEAMNEFNVGPGRGYDFFYRSDEVVQCMRDMYHNLNETFGYVDIPEDFVSPNELVKTWLWFYKYLLSKNELFEDVQNYFDKSKKSEIDDKVNYSLPFVEINSRRYRLIELLSFILQLPEVIIYIPYEEGIINTNRNNHIYDIAIITAINSPEFRAAKEIIDGLQRVLIDNDPTLYFEGTITTNTGRRITVITACDDKMGMPAATSLSMKIIFHFKPKYLVMLGICAGIKGKVNIGDIIIPELVWDYGSGKNTLEKSWFFFTKEVFIPYLNQLSIDVHLETLMKNIASENRYVDEIQRLWINDNENNPFNNNIHVQLKAKVGPFSSGSAVIANEKIVKKINSNHGKLLGFDMEAYGVFYATRYSPFPEAKALVIKSVSDYGDSNKGKDEDLKNYFQSYAAYTSATFLKKIIENELLHNI